MKSKFELLVGMIVAISLFVSCNNDKNVSSSDSGRWMTTSRLTLCTEESQNSVYMSFDELAESTCNYYQMTYSGEWECRDGYTWVKCVEL